MGAIQQMMMAESVVTGAPTYATWDPSNKGSDLTLSNGNLTFTTTYSIGTNHMVRATLGKTTGKWYWEVKVDSLTATVPPMLGIATAAAPITTLDGTSFPATGHTSYYYGNSGQEWIDGSNSAFGSSYTAGDTIGFALDAGTRILTCYKNNVSQGSFSAIGGADPIYPVGGYSSSSTANFGASALTYTPPSGYNAGVY
jgi:hypothetical protein